MNIKKLINELIGTAVLLIAVVGSSYMASSLTTDKALSLLIIAAVTAAALAIIIKSGAAISGAHYNPAVTISSLLTSRITQIIGAIIGVLIANAMFGETLIGSSSIVRSGSGQFIGEVVATAGLVYLALTATEKSVWKMIPLWIFAAYFFTASTSFANPAVTISRIFTDAPTGISGESVLGFISAQIVGALLTVLALKSKVMK
jgi:glycerol uptake facilitator-like aquaporin